MPRRNGSGRREVSPAPPTPEAYVHAARRAHAREVLGFPEPEGRLQQCAASNAEIEAAMARLAPFPEGQRMVDTLMQGNPNLTWGDAIVQADGLFIGKTIKLLEEFKETGAHYDEMLGREFPIFKGYAPEGHPYLAAWTKGKKPEKFFQGEGHKLGDGAGSSKLDGMD